MALKIFTIERTLKCQGTIVLRKSITICLTGSLADIAAVKLKTIAHL
jgi:hypothetical protein